jgi:hypothetical protein
MKTIAEAEAALKLELWHWCNKQAQNLYTAYYLYFLPLYFLPSAPEHDGGLIIAADKPANPEFELAWPQRIDPSATVEQNFNRLRLDCLRHLPILSF